MFGGRRRTEGLRKLLGYFDSIFLLFITYFFIYTPSISNKGLKIADNNELELLKITGF